MTEYSARNETASLAGRLRQRVVLQQKVESPDGAGGVIYAWQTVATVWAEVTPAYMNEKWEGERAVSRITHHVTLRYRTGVAPGMRVLHGARPLTIRHCVNLGERGIASLLLCEEEDA